MSWGLSLTLLPTLTLCNCGAGGSSTAKFLSSERTLLSCLSFTGLSGQSLNPPGTAPAEVAFQPGSPARLLSHYPGHLPVHQADLVEIDAVKHKEANVGILESSFLKDNRGHYQTSASGASSKVELEKENRNKRLHLISIF